MGRNTLIPWTDHSHNFWTGCHRVSLGCDHCYMHTAKQRWGKDPELVTRTSDATFYAPLKWEKSVLAKASGMLVPKPESVFCNSWSDFFLEEADRQGKVGRGWRDDAWSVILATPHLRWLILTKRPERIPECLPFDWGDGWPNVAIGVTVESWRERQRIEVLRGIPAMIRFVSIEPYLDELGWVDWRGIHWGIVGAETGPSARPCPSPSRLLEEWEEQGVKRFVKGRLAEQFPIHEHPHA